MLESLVKTCSLNSIDFQQYLILHGLYNENLKLVEEYHTVENYNNGSSIQTLVHLGFLQRLTTPPNNTPYSEVLNGNLIITKLAIERFFKNSTNQSTPTSEGLSITSRYKVAWIEEWYDLFPKGVKSGGYYVRTSIKSCDKRMFKFLTDNPAFTKNIILEATKIYVEQMKVNNYSMMKLAPNFIYKDGMSMLSGCCDAYVEGVNNNQDTYSNDNTFGIKV